MTIHIINLSDMIKVNLEYSIQAFVALSKKTQITKYDCGGFLSWTFSPVLSRRSLLQAALFYYDKINGIIPNYKLGKLETDKFINDCLLHTLPCPAGKNEAEWKNELVAAWNAMIQIDHAKLEALNTFIKNHREDQFIYITNSNELHTDYINAQSNNQFLAISCKDLEEKVKSNQPIRHTISSHTAGNSKTSGMIAQIAKITGKDDVQVVTSYTGDANYCEGLDLQCVVIGDNFDYSMFTNPNPQLKKQQ